MRGMLTMLNALVFDFETTFSNKGHFADQTNRAVVLGWKWVGENCPTQELYLPKTSEESLHFPIKHIQSTVDRADILVAFNAKFDLHWLRKIGIDFTGKRIWDCQIGEFLLNYQKTPYPSLDQAAEKYGLAKKLDVVKLDYWERGINTDEIPREVLSEYLTQDLILTEQVYLKQVEEVGQGGLLPLFKLQCLDLLTLQECEWNGIYFDTTQARAKAAEIEKELIGIYNRIVELVGNLPFNLNSNDHISAILYGGSIFIDSRIPVGVYKTGEKVGQTRYKIIVKEYILPQLAKPLKGTEVKKPEGTQPIWKTNDEILQTLVLNKEGKKLVGLIRKHSELEKLRGTYLIGWSELILKMHWPTDMIHGNLNQCVAITGRLSSTRPNLQNASPEIKQYCTSRYIG